MGSLIVYEYYRDTVKNLIICIFIAGLCLLTTVLYSFLDYEYGKYRPFKSFEKEAGYIAFTPAMGAAFFEQEEVEHIDKKYGLSKTSLKINDSFAKTYVYGEWIWKNWRGRLKEGEWFNNDIKRGIIDVVIGGNTTGYKIGEKYKQSDGKVVRIIGILQNDAEVFNDESYNAAHRDYLSFYGEPFIDEDDIFAICQDESLNADENGQFVSSGMTIYTYEKGLSEEEIYDNNKKLNRNHEGMGLVLESYKESNEMKLRQKIMSYLPTIIVSLVMIIISIYCISYIKIQRSNRVYSVYYLNGASEKTLYKIVVGYALMMVLVSALIYVILGTWFDYYAKTHNVMFSFSTSPVLLPIILYIIFGIIMSLCLIIELKGKSAVELIKKTVEV